MKTKYTDFLAVEMWGDPDKLQGDINHINETRKILGQAIKAAKKQDLQTFRTLMDQAERRTRNMVNVTEVIYRRASTAYRLLEQKEAFEK